MAFHRKTARHRVGDCCTRVTSKLGFPAADATHRSRSSGYSDFSNSSDSSVGLRAIRSQVDMPGYARQLMRAGSVFACCFSRVAGLGRCIVSACVVNFVRDVGVHSGGGGAYRSASFPSDVCIAVVLPRFL